jgi:hypothetical protein
MKRKPTNPPPPAPPRQVTVPAGIVIEAVQIMNRMMDLDLTGKEARKLSQLLAHLDLHEEFLAVDKQRVALVKKYAKAGEGLPTVDPAQMEAFSKEYHETLWNTPIAISADRLLPANIVDKVPQITGRQIRMLEPFMEVND